MTNNILCRSWLLLLPLVSAADSGGHAVTLWMAEGASNTVYLLGSVHLLREKDHPLPSIIDAAYDDAETLFMELDMDDLDPIATQATINRLGMLDEDQSLRDVMGEDLYEDALRAAAALDIPLDMLAQTEPWFAAITVEQLALTRIGFNPLYGIEMHMMTKAIQDGKAIQGFESVEEQLEFLDGLSLEAQRDLLMQTLAEGADIRDMMDRLIEAWRMGDIAYMEENLLADIANYPELYESIVADRNRDWANTIDKLLKADEDYLVIVGALHLIGKDGLPRLLESRGYEVNQLHERQQ
jgi:uncharacterized protein YbaP (TraB family)